MTIRMFGPNKVEEYFMSGRTQVYLHLFYTVLDISVSVLLAVILV